ncbi:MAG: hypothetical protein AABZ77_03650, partial [Chloroflexota bacterium]
LLMFVLMFGLYTSVQVTQLPIWNSQIDLQSYETAYGDFLFLKSDIRNVALLKQPKNTVIRMGARYPDRMVFINPRQGISGQMSIEDATGTITYTIDITGQPTFTENITSSRLIYESMGAERIKIIWEHGLIIRQFPAGSASTDSQELIVGENLYLPLLDASLFSPKSSMRPESFSLKPYSASRIKLNVKNVLINLPTAYPAVWADRLEGLSTDDMTVSVNQTAGIISINSTAIRRIRFPQDPATDAQFVVGVIYLDTTTVAGFDPTTEFPQISGITITTESSTTATITATVKNATAPFDIHADLTDITGNLLKFDVLPDYSNDPAFPIDAGSWNTPNQVQVKWRIFTHTQWEQHTVKGVVFTVYNNVLDQRYVRTQIFRRSNNNAWQE